MNLLFKYKKTTLFIIAFILMCFWGGMRLSLPLGTKKTIQSMSLIKGSGSLAVAEQLSMISKNSGGSLSAFEIQILSFLTGRSEQFKSGDYDINPRASLNNVLNKIARGEVTILHVRLAEGETWEQLKPALLRADLQHNAQNLDASQLATELKMNASSAEGLLFPDTYQYRRGETETAVLNRAAQTMQARLSAAWDKRAANLPYKTPYDALIMASIIEKETGTASDRPLIAAVFVNRLRSTMRLQTDPAVIYGITNFNGNLTKADLQRDTPYNTYTREGLPPTPIATASAASLAAALHPADSKALYFVARGDGSSQFSETLAQHNAAVQKYQINPAKAAKTAP